jgi:hypothetical protein
MNTASQWRWLQVLRCRPSGICDACAIIRTREVVILPFREVPAEFAHAEGEGDGSLAWWRRVHREYYVRELAGTSYTPTDDMPVVCQYFDVAFPKAHGSVSSTTSRQAAAPPNEEL